VKKRQAHPARRLIESTCRQPQTYHTLVDWLGVEYAIEKPSKKLLAATDLDSDTWVPEVKRIRGKKLPLGSFIAWSRLSRARLDGRAY
jgi:hypothetical protein